MGISPDELTIVVPTRNERANIGRFLSAVPPAVRLIVVDSSDDETPELIEALRPDTDVVRVRANIPVARQIGADRASTEWILFTDADVLLGPGYLDHLTGPTIGGAVDDRVGGIVGTKATIDGFDRYHRWFRRGQGALHRFGVPAATGSNMLIRSEALRAVGGFDPGLSVNEDTEIMFRIARGGWRVRFAPRLVAVSFDHRRLEMGLARKLVHGAVRNTSLYFGLFERQIRAGDWGYWDDGAARLEQPVPEVSSGRE